MCPEEPRNRSLLPRVVALRIGENSRSILLEHICNPRYEETSSKPINEDIFPPFLLILLTRPDTPQPSSWCVVMIVVVPTAATNVSFGAVRSFRGMRRRCRGSGCERSEGYSRSDLTGSDCAGGSRETLRKDGHGGGRGE